MCVRNIFGRPHTPLTTALTTRTYIQTRARASAVPPLYSCGRASRGASCCCATLSDSLLRWHPPSRSRPNSPRKIGNTIASWGKPTAKLYILRLRLPASTLPPWLRRGVPSRCFFFISVTSSLKKLISRVLDDTWNTLDRFIPDRLWGDHGQANLEAAHVCLINATGLGTEVLKSLVLPGIGAFTIVDGKKITGEDIEAKYVLVILWQR